MLSGVSLMCLETVAVFFMGSMTINTPQYTAYLMTSLYISYRLYAISPT